MRPGDSPLGGHCNSDSFPIRTEKLQRTGIFREISICALCGPWDGLIPPIRRPSRAMQCFAPQQLLMLTRTTASTLGNPPAGPRPGRPGTPCRLRVVASADQLVKFPQALSFDKRVFVATRAAHRRSYLFSFPPSGSSVRTAQATSIGRWHADFADVALMRFSRGRD